MIGAFPLLDGLRPNPDWAKLPLFDRKEWKRVRFGDVVQNLNETERNPAEAGIERFIGLEHLEPGSLHIHSWGNVADGTTFTRRCRPGQVLFGKRRAYQRKVAVAEFDAVVSGDIYVLMPKNDRLLPGVLPFLCMSERFFQHAVGTSAGSLSPRTNWSSLAGFEFDLPPLGQQRHIAEILWAVDEVEQRKAALIASIAAAREAWLEALITGDAVHQTRIEELGQIITGTTPKTSEARYYEPAECLFVSPADISGSRYVTATEKRISRDGLDTGRPIPRDAVMVVCIGSTIGKVAMASERCLTNQQINSVVCKPEHNPLVVFYSLCRQQKLFRQAASCTAVPILNKGNFSALSIPIPANGVQDNVAARLLEFEQAEVYAKEAVLSSRNLTATLLNEVMP
ncbi:MAG: restriction endonuclease subunit S [bacterium]